MVQPLEILKSKGAMGILELFLSEPGRELSQADICRKSGISRTTATKWLRMLKESGMLRPLERGRSVYYRIEQETPVVRQLKVLVTTAKLYGIFRKVKSENMEMYLFGSAARGEDTEKSDIDLLILGKPDRPSVMAAIEDARRIMKRDVKPMFLSHLDYSSMARKDRIFYENVEKTRIRIV
jgi:predicted nucleotidyltransferase